MRKILTAVAMLAALLIIGFFAFNAFIYREKQGDPADVRAYRGTLTGEVVCLPHAGDGPHTKECAMGLRTDVGEHYALDVALLSQEAAPLETGERITATGLITPLELLSTDHWQRYAIEGIFSVTDSLQRL